MNQIPTNLTNEQKQTLKSEADKHIHHLQTQLQGQIDQLAKRNQEAYDMIPELQGMDIFSVSPDSEARDQAIARIKLYTGMQEEMKAIQDSPYFARLDISWNDGERQTIYISKFSMTAEDVYSWVTPIATLRFADIGNAEYQKPGGGSRAGDLERKDDFIITGGEIVFMTHTAKNTPRQVIFQRHFSERRSFLLPEIVAELDRIQDQIIRSDPHGGFLISGPAGSGKTTLALHRIAYLVLTPDFKDVFLPERIMVFVADAGAIKYFSNLLPELGINGVRITTFNEWSLMIVNSRFRAPRITQRFRFFPRQEAIEHIQSTGFMNKVHPRLVLDEIRKYKQQLIMTIGIAEGTNKLVFSKLKSHYLSAIEGMDGEFQRVFKSYINFQITSNYLDEVDIIILLLSLEQPVSPFAHIVIDEVQNWLPEQLQFVQGIADRRYNSISYIGDIRQKTKAFSIQSWEDIAPGTEGTLQKAELLKVYRNTKQVLEYLQKQQYEIQVPDHAREGAEILSLQLNKEGLEAFIDKEIKNVGGKQIGIIAKYQETISDLEHITYDNDNVHVLTIEEAQGLEFHTTIIIDPEKLHANPDIYHKMGLSHSSSQEYADQDRHLLYVAITRTQEQLITISLS